MVGDPWEWRTSVASEVRLANLLATLDTTQALTLITTIPSALATLVSSDQDSARALTSKTVNGVDLSPLSA